MLLNVRDGIFFANITLYFENDTSQTHSYYEVIGGRSICVGSNDLELRDEKDQNFRADFRNYA